DDLGRRVVDDADARVEGPDSPDVLGFRSRVAEDDPLEVGLGLGGDRGGAEAGEQGEAVLQPLPRQARGRAGPGRGEPPPRDVEAREQQLVDGHVVHGSYPPGPDLSPVLGAWNETNHGRVPLQRAGRRRSAAIRCLRSTMLGKYVTGALC